MIRLILLSAAFVAVTAGLLWTAGDRPDPVATEDQVTRAAPAALDLTPAMPLSEPAAPIAAAVVAPAEVPTDASDAAVVSSLRPPAGRTDDVMEALRAMSYGIVDELKKPETVAAPAPAREPATTNDPTAMQAALGQRLKSGVATAPAPAPLRTYTVQEGDSLPGIAFKFYGSTVAYLSILQANPDQLTDPGDVRAGMVLTIPEL